MALFVIGDTHLSLSVNKPMDIFGGWKNYMQRLETLAVSIMRPPPSQKASSRPWRRQGRTLPSCTRCPERKS